MIIDGHVHMGKGDFGTLDELKQDMQKAGIDKAVLVPGGMIDVRRMTRYITGVEKPKGDDIPNDVIEHIIHSEPDKFYGFYCVNPHKRREAVIDLENGIQKGFKGLKLAPIVHGFSLASKTVMELADLCGQYNVPFYSHVLFSPGASTKKMAALAKEFPNTNFIIGHMGFGPADVDAMEYAAMYDNLYLETSQGSFAGIKTALETCGSSKLIFGSEFPLYKPISSLMTIRELNCKESDFDNILYKNIQYLLNVK
ncbi:amidohydrolase family protein [Mobilitalea sibirica]|uniref:Amidohydrolase family protein n=1 Tax=Mobilitalea sibirica TaxID=1462919 RepID=A0A8J7H8Q0_9FIRM|nr:amidohydrolase family protein [Mobilitalea sibirica]MBH1940430.1 amidohydrolase family protein [Mobilitalea sibirica]